MLAITAKRCSACGVTKSLTDFYVKSGRSCAECKCCAIAKTAAWVKKNPDKRRATWQRWLARHRERHNEQARAWTARHPDRKRAQSQAWIDRHPEKRKLAAGEYVKRNLDKANAGWHKRRARIKGNGGQHTADDIARLYETQSGRCANLVCRMCLGRRAKYHVDHIIPIALGGTDNPDNLQLLCAKCNGRKSAKPPERWAQENGVLF